VLALVQDGFRPFDDLRASRSPRSDPNIIPVKHPDTFKNKKMKNLLRPDPWESCDGAARISCSALLLAIACAGLLALVVGCGSASSVSTPSGPGSSSGQPQLSASVSTVSFGSVLVGSSNTQTITLTSSGTTTVNLSQASISGSGFTMSGVTTPMKLPVGQTATLTVKFAPEQAGRVTGNISLASDAMNSPTLISLNGTGTAATLQLSVTPTSLNFGNVAVGASGTQTATLTNTGNSSLNIAQISVSGGGFSSTGAAPPSTLTAGQTATLSIAFSPTSASNFTGTVAVASNATNTPATISLMGTGVQATHWATLNWVASNSQQVTGYNAYRATETGGSYAKVNTSLITATTYTDYEVQSGQTYYYVVTAVNSGNLESVYSTPSSTTIP
jgi:Abnormal spindle-like microcephaly-assoc'd, ASPM-SPD-2-Hydin